MSVPSRTASEDDSRSSSVASRRCGNAISGRVKLRKVGAAELEDLGAEPELAAVDADVAEVDEGEQEAACGGAGEPGRAGHVAERQGRIVGIEGTDHGQAPLQRLHEIRLPIGQPHLGGLASGARAP